MTHELEKQIQRARPTLRVVSPLAHHIVLLFGIFNILIGLSFLAAVDQSRFTASLLIVNQVLTFNFWGCVFIGLGSLKLYALKVNNWHLSRNSLLMGVAIKAAWAVALIIRIFVVPGTLFLTLIWVLLALIQIVTYIFFMPPSTSHYLQRRKDRQNENK